MKDLYQPAVVSELHSRFAKLSPDSAPLWGKMTAAQMAAHCAKTMEYALGEFAACTKEPHFFFGAMTPAEWAQFSYVHLDHHLRQFGV